MNILLLGSGGRECALAWKISQSDYCNKLFIAPGNAGTNQYGTNIELNPLNFDAIGHFSIENKINLIIVGPETPLVEGIVDHFKNDINLKHVKILGPDRKAALLEGSKSFAKAFMKHYNIPTAEYVTYDSERYTEAIDFLHQTDPPYVIKADGLAAGKGVVICQDIKTATETIDLMLKQNRFGLAGKKIVIEKFLDGIELSVFILTDGKSYIMLPEAKDYKRVGDNNTGANTGGMGSFSPVPFATPEFINKIRSQIIEPTLIGVQQERLNYKGFLFFGLIKVNDDPYVLEYNVRLGDPETQVILPRIKNDLVELLTKVFDSNLSEAKLSVLPDHCVNITIAANGYPDKFEKGATIELPEIPNNILIFHAGTINQNGRIISNGGRVISITSMHMNPHIAINTAYDIADKINYEHKYFRRDIGKDILSLC